MEATDNLKERFTIPATKAPDLNFRSRRMYRNRALNNLLKMGHCAPSALRTLLDKEGKNGEWLVRMTAGLPGGIGNTGYECGGVTAALIKLGLDFGLNTGQDGLPVVVSAGHEYARHFNKCHNSLFCREILGDRRIPLPCIKVVRHVPELYRQAGCCGDGGMFYDETREAILRVYSHMSEKGFHCAHSVLMNMSNSIPVTPELLNGTSGFIGGTVFKGYTCSALTAGIMAIGLQLGEIEDSYRRVVRMLATMIAGGNAMADHMNKFNRVINIGNRMSKWFAEEFGSTLCREITRCDFSSPEQVNLYIRQEGVAYCKHLAEKVAGKTEYLIKSS